MEQPSNVQKLLRELLEREPAGAPVADWEWLAVYGVASGFALVLVLAACVALNWLVTTLA